MSKFISLLLLTLIITSCDENRTFYVAPAFANCDGAGKQMCLQVKENIEDDWTLLYDQIEGFDYKEGFTYKLEVSVSKVKNPPADDSVLKYKLVKLIYQEPADEKIAVAQTLSGKWRVERMIDMDSLAVKPTLSFENGQVSGNAGCNNYGAKFTIKENSISIGLAMSTKMYCTNMHIEKAFFDCLQSATYYKIKDDRLYIYSEKNEELISSLAEN